MKTSPTELATLQAMGHQHLISPDNYYDHLIKHTGCEYKGNYLQR